MALVTERKESDSDASFLMCCVIWKISKTFQTDIKIVNESVADVENYIW